MSWRSAMETALYGPEGFFRTEAPGDHFRTSVHVSDLFATALLSLARSYGLNAVVDVGAGRGELLLALHRLDPELSLTGVERAARPADLPVAVTWQAEVPYGVDALVVANEWLDNVPLDIACVDDQGVPRMIEVDLPTGTERLGDPITGPDAEWLERWWPPPLRPGAEPGGTRAEPGTRAEIGRTRDEAWARVITRMSHGLALAVDYGHDAANRPALGTLCGYREGHQVPPIPDGSCDITAHVAMDSVRAAGEAAGARTVSWTTQAEALRALGLSGARPSQALARSDPAGYLAALSRASEATELLDPAGLGGYRWLLQAVH